MNSSFEAYGIAPLTAPPILAATILCASSFFIAFFAAFWVVITRDTKTVRRAQPAAAFLTLFALALLNGSVLLALGRPMNVGLCVGRIYGVNLALLCVLASQVMKGWHLFRYAYSLRYTSDSKLPEERFFVIMMVFLVFFGGILLAWTFLEPIGPNETQSGCISEGSKIAEVVALCALGALWMVWTFFSFYTWNLKPYLTEYSWISSMVGGAAAVVAIVASHASKRVFTDEIRLVAEATASSVFTLTMIALCLIPKLCGEEAMDAGDIKDELDENTATVFERSQGRVSHATTISVYSGKASGASTKSSQSYIDRSSRSKASPDRRKTSTFSSKSSTSSRRSSAKSSTSEPASQASRASSLTVYNPPPTFTEEGMWL